VESIFEAITWLSLTLGLLFILWKGYLFVAWNIERAIFLTSVSYYLKQDSKRRK